jgi:hypothetical protein
LKALLKSLVADADAAIALIIAAVAAVAGLSGAVSDVVINSSILGALAALALSILRGNWRGEATEPEMRTALGSMAGRLDSLVERLDRSDEIKVLVGSEISETLARARRGSHVWVFKGGSGTFIRAVTLPECVRAAREDRRKLDFRLEILDPTDTELCERYVNYFRSMKDNDTSGWTSVDTQKELYATILASCWWQQRYALLEVQIALSSTMATFRWELSTDSLIITERHPKYPALQIKRGHYLYGHWHSELKVSFDQARRVDLSQATLLSDQPTVEEARDTLRAVAVGLPDHYTDDDVTDVIKRAVHADNPYE